MKSKTQEKTKEELEISELHYNWYVRHTKKVPPNLLRSKYILRKNELGISILHLAAQSGQLNQVPKEFLTQKFLTKEDTNGKTAMAHAAYGGHFKQIPRELWTQENLTKKGTPNVLHELAASGNLDILPQELLTKANLLTENAIGNNCFNAAARIGKFEQIPKDTLDLNILTKKDQYNQSIIDHLAFQDNLHLLDNSWISEQTLLNTGDCPAFDSILIHAEDHKDYSQLKKVVNLLDHKAIKKILDTYKDVLTEKALTITTKEYKRKVQIGVFKKLMHDKQKNRGKEFSI